MGTESMNQKLVNGGNGFWSSFLSLLGDRPWVMAAAGMDENFQEEEAAGAVLAEVIRRMTWSILMKLITRTQRQMFE